MIERSLHRLPLHQQIASRLRGHITKRLTSGHRLDSETDLALKFGVSVHTIREALSALEQEGLVERRHGRGTFVASAPERHVALWLVVDPTFRRSKYAHAVLDHLHRFLSEQRISTRAYVVMSSNEDYAHDASHAELIRALSQHRISAIGLVSGTFSAQALELAHQHGIPIVWNDRSEQTPFSVGHNVAGMIRKGTEYLLDRGCRNIAYMGWHSPERLIGSSSYHTFESVLRSRGLTACPEWVRGDLKPALEGAGYAEFREIWTARQEKPDGLLVTDDVLFRDVAVAILEMRIRVPEQLNVVAHANKGMVTAPFFPAPRLEFDPQEHARTAAEMLARLALGKTVGSPQIQLECRWVEPPRVPVAAGANRQGMAP